VIYFLVLLTLNVLDQMRRLRETIIFSPWTSWENIIISPLKVERAPCASGYVYLVFENEKSVRALLHACSQDPFHPEDNREYYFKMSSRRMRCKDVSSPISEYRGGGGEYITTGWVNGSFFFTFQMEIWHFNFYALFILEIEDLFLFHSSSSWCSMFSVKITKCSWI